VVNSEGNLLGIVTTTDIMHAALGVHLEAQAHGSAPRSGPEPQLMKLSAQEIDQALAAAQAAMVGEADVVHRALVYMHARVTLLEQMRRIASRFMQAGQDQQLHSALCKALAAIGMADERGYVEVVTR
jgi:CBS domain-containing protein